MDIALLVLAVALAAVALALVWQVRGRTIRLGLELGAARRDLDRTQADVSACKRDLDHVQHELEQAYGQLNELKAATEVAPPPLPRPRGGGLDDLRQRLRAAHTEDDPSEE